MAINTTIQWTDSTVNPTMGCDGCELWTKTKNCEKSALSQAAKDSHSCYADILRVRQMPIYAGAKGDGRIRQRRVG